MSENANSVNAATEVSVVDMIMDGDSHSPLVNKDEIIPENTAENTNQKENEAPAAEVKKTDAEDSAKSVQNDLKAAQDQISNLSKRLHDTQNAFHRANEERSRLEKEIAELRTKKENDDDWFSDDDKKRLDKLNTELEANQQQMEQIEDMQEQNQQQAVYAQWNLAAVEFSKEHPDFNQVVYEKFAPLLDAETGDPAVKAMWDAQKEKTPEHAYKVAKMLFAIQEQETGAVSNNASTDGEVETKNNQEVENTALVEGKEGLDLLNSADAQFATDTETDNGSAVDFIFK